MLLVSFLERNGEQTRERILSALRANPGMNKSELHLTIGLSWTTIAYHLKILERQGAIHLAHEKRDVFCFPVDIPQRYRDMLSTLRDDNATRILGALLEDDAIGITELSASLGMSQKMVRKHLGRLHESGLVVKRGELRPRFTKCPGLPTDSAMRTPLLSSMNESPDRRMRK
jgi:DNA-binding transcriptional ArsR family regulator